MRNIAKLKSPSAIGAAVLAVGLLMSAGIADRAEHGAVITPSDIMLIGAFVSLLLGASVTALAILIRHRHLEDEMNRSSGQLRSAQRRLMESEKLLQRAENVSRVGGFMIDLATGQQQWTHQTYRIHDLDESAMPSQELLNSLLAPADRDRLHEAMNNARATGLGYDLEIPLVTASNRAIRVRMAAEVERDARGEPVRIVGAIQDITDRCKLERRLRDALVIADKASKSKSEFLANMSHEIRTPLNAVIGLGYLLEQTTLNDEQRQFLTKIQFAGRALLGVINNVLDLSKIEADEMSLEDEPFDLPELVQDLGQMLLPQAVQKHIELIVDSSPSLPRLVMGDASRVRQILTNLLNNAIKFTEKGHVHLTVFCTEQSSGRIRLRCEVKDTGIGIDPAACDRLFTPFTQADASTTRKFGGTGLGLSIARRFVELMGGEIGVSSGVAAGSTFWIEMPMRIAPETGSLTDALRILILDPKGEHSHGLGAMVRALGWNPQVVDSADHLLSIMTGNSPLARPDALILDLHTRDIDAHGIIERLENQWHDGELPSVIVVADSTLSYPIHKERMRAADVLLVRPVTSSALFNAINLVVSRQPDSADRVFESTNFDELHAQWLSGVRVLVVDDSDINLEVAQRILENQGAVVITCSNGLSAINELQSAQQAIDVVLMDVQMPILDGNEAARRIRADLGLRVPVVALTAGALVGERQRSLDAGMDDFLSKPFDPQVLIRKVRRLVELARGEPIPMVFDDRRTANPQDGRPLMKSINAGMVQQMFGDDMALFKSLLGRMLRDYADFGLPMTVSRENDDAREALRARSHKLKGSAGMIGATHVMRLAGAVERALHEGRPAEVVEGILAKLSHSLATLCEEAKPLLETKTARGVSDAPLPASQQPIDHPKIEELCELLESHNLAAVERFELLQPSLRQWLDVSRLAALSDAVENLDFQIGADLLREIRQERMVVAA